MNNSYILIYEMYIEKFKDPSTHHIIPFLEWLVKENIITDETLDKLHMIYVLDQRDKRAKTMKNWLEEDSVLWQLIRGE